MPTPPPVPAAQRYPLAIRDFVTYQNQPGDNNHIVQSSTGSVDLTLDGAVVTRDLHTEIISLEQTIGANPFMVPGNPTIGKSIQWLHSNLSPGHVGPRGSIDPLPPPSHSHVHQQMSGRSGDDHPQYMLVNGTRPFINPVTAPAAQNGHELITLAQAKNAGLTWQQVQNIINQSLTAAMDGGASGPILGPDNRRWKMAGGYFNGYTDENGNAYVDFSAAHFSGLLSFIYMKMPFPGQSMLGWYNYQYMEDQLILLGLSNTGALIQFIEDIVVDRRANVACTWIALGI